MPGSLGPNSSRGLHQLDGNFCNTVALLVIGMGIPCRFSVLVHLS